MMTATEGPALVLLCGTSFSGKSTLGRLLAHELPAHIVSLDAVNEERGLSGGQGIPEQEWARTFEKARRRVDGLLSQGQAVVVDDTSSPRFLRDGWRDTAAEHSSSFLLVYLGASEALVLERLGTNRRHGTRENVTDEVMRRHLTAFEPPGADERHLLVDAADYRNDAVLTQVRTALLQGD